MIGLMDIFILLNGYRWLEMSYSLVWCTIGTVTSSLTKFHFNNFLNLFLSFCVELDPKECESCLIMGSSLTGSMLNKMSQFYACYCMSLQIYSITWIVPVCGSSLPLLNMRKLSALVKGSKKGRFKPTSGGAC